MSTLPFYSPLVREALVQIIANHPSVEEPGVGAPSHRAAGSLRTTSATRGKWSGYDPSSSDDDSIGEKNDKKGSDSDDEATSSSASSMEAIDENEEQTQIAPAVQQQQQQQQRNGGKISNKQSKKKSKKNKKSKDDLLHKLGKAPSILLPIEDITNKNGSNNTNKKDALEVPNVLLPINYMRDNPNWRVSSVANSLLSTWDQLSNKNDSEHSPERTIIVVLLQSGRFAAAVFSLQNNNNNNTSSSLKMIAHKTSTRYTVRKGQGGSQSSHDQSKNKAKSVGAQLRREGEKQLREDVRSTWKEWKHLGYAANAQWVYVSCPKGMRRDYLFGGGGGDDNDSSLAALIAKDDARLRSIPLDVGRPTMEGTAAVLDCVLSCSVRAMTDDEYRSINLGDNDGEPENKKQVVKEDAGKESNDDKIDVKKDTTTKPEALPFTPLHQAVLDGDLSRLLDVLKLLDESEEQDASNQSNITAGDQPTTPASAINYDINTTGGPDNQTPLHIASSSTHPNATSIVNTLLIQGHANPCAVDARGRVPYFLASSDKHRETFRLARGTLGEDYCSWDDGAKVGPALSDADVQAKKAKALEKKRRQRARQKEKKANEKAVAEEEAERKRLEDEKKRNEEDAKRIRHGLKPRTSGAASNVCDFCQKVVKGKRRSQMYQRLEYAYCSTECVKRHQRELMAAAATARMG